MELETYLKDYGLTDDIIRYAIFTGTLTKYSISDWRVICYIIDDPDLDRETKVAMIEKAFKDDKWRAKELFVFIETLNQFVKADDILSGAHEKDSWGKGTPSEQFAISVSLCEALKKMKTENKLNSDEQIDVFDRFVVYIMDMFSPEMVVLTFRHAIKQYGIKFDIHKHSEFKKAMKAYNRIILA